VGEAVTEPVADTAETGVLTTPASRKALNKRIKRWPGWVLLAFVVAGFLAVGAFRSTGPETQADRVDAIASRVACPICAGESVFVSQNSASRAIRSRIGELVAENDLSDADIVAVIETRYGAQVLLVPRSSGFDALIWVLPAVALICGLAGLTVVFRRWKREGAATADPTAADRQLVASALAADAADAAAVGAESAASSDGAER
jgi:cytochrome c-type biogenesis protein CcmH